jgi:hypothetical protein
MIELLERMRAALDAHDLDTFVGFFRGDYVGERPRYPGSPRLAVVALDRAGNRSSPGHLLLRPS